MVPVSPRLKKLQRNNIPESNKDKISLLHLEKLTLALVYTTRTFLKSWAKPCRRQPRGSLGSSIRERVWIGEIGQIGNDCRREKQKTKVTLSGFKPNKSSSPNQRKGELPFHKTHQNMVLIFFLPQLPLMFTLIQNCKVTVQCATFDLGVVRSNPHIGSRDYLKNKQKN